MLLLERTSQHQLVYGNEVIVFSVRPQPTRTVQRVAIHVEPDGRVLVDAPDTAPLVDEETACRISRQASGMVMK